MKSFDELVGIVKLLRSPRGCPWDRAQTIESMLVELRAEVDEAAEAFAKKDTEEFKKELGDILADILRIARIAEEEKKFSLASVLRSSIRKIKFRKSWVFGSDHGKVKTAAEALALWKVNKQKEKGLAAKKR